MYIKLDQENPIEYSTGQLFQDNPNTSFPSMLTDETLSDWGMYPYTYDAQPTYDETIYRLVAGSFREEGGSWFRGWNLEVHVDAEDRVRKKRDNLLAQCDWTQVADAPVDKTAWAIYRQSLRDIPEQDGFPNNVIWPVK